MVQAGIQVDAADFGTLKLTVGSSPELKQDHGHPWAMVGHGVVRVI